MVDATTTAAVTATSSSSTILLLQLRNIVEQAACAVRDVEEACVCLMSMTRGSVREPPRAVFPLRWRRNDRPRPGQAPCPAGAGNSAQT
ncbi:hypothetical protein CMV_022014 [Castanea mollissima]|uniref:Uncharacterized protein n=1 Tax=Castanea mollissima TaxID=60419 RepID=A0A8J4QEM2_9ROSI|nr:hypothetical protein CMV_022014 [Castanea mollissima]